MTVFAHDRFRVELHAVDIFVFDLECHDLVVIETHCRWNNIIRDTLLIDY